ERDGRLVVALALSPDGSHLASAGQDGTIKLIAVHTCNSDNTISAHGVSRMTFSPDGAYLVTVTPDDRMTRIWGVASGQEIARQVFPTNSLGDVLAIGIDGRTVGVVTHEPTAIGDADTIHVWNWRPKDQIAEACSRLSRNLTRDDEWRRFFPQEPFRR